jgi:hypothetical protein
MLHSRANQQRAQIDTTTVERPICTTKERTKCLIQGLPFKRIPRAIIRAAIENANKSLNQFPTKKGVSDTLSPLTIMTGRPNPNHNDMKIEFGAYAQVYEDGGPTNTVRARTTGPIALTPTGNAQGGYYFLSLTTGRKLSRQQWDELPMPDGVIATVERIAQTDNQPLVGQGAPLFEWSPSVPIEDDELAPIILNDNGDPQAFEEEEDAEEDEGADETFFGGEEPDPSDDGEDDIASETNEQPPEEYTIEDDMSGHDDALDEDGHGDEGEEHQNHAEELPGGALEDDASVVKEPRTGAQARYNLRSNRARDFSNRLYHAMDNNPANTQSYETQIIQYGNGNAPTLREAVQEMQRTGSDSDVLKCVTGIVMMQMTAKAGIKKHGQVAIDALFNEFSQLHDLTVFHGQNKKGLTRAQKKAALRAINVIKEMRRGKIKGRTVANGRAQKSLYAKDETSSATVATNALMVSILIDRGSHRIHLRGMPLCKHERLHAS